MSRMYAAAFITIALAVFGREAISEPPSASLLNEEGQMVLLTLESSTGFVASTSMGGTMLLSRDGWATASIRLGPSQCQTSGTFGARFDPISLAQREELGSAAALWTISARLVSSHEDHATVDVRWRRDVGHAGLLPGQDAESEQRLDLRMGRRGVLDLVTGDPARGECASFAILLGLEMRPPLAVSDAAIAYDLWLIQDQIDGQQTVERFTAIGRQGDDTAFFFRTLDYSAAGIHLSDVSHSELRQSIQGTLIGTLFDTDRIDLTIDVSQNVGHEGGTIGSGGRKRLTVRNGETVQFDLPSSIEGHVSKLGDVGQIFKGQRTAIRLTPRVLWRRTN